MFTKVGKSVQKAAIVNKNGHNWANKGKSGQHWATLDKSGQKMCKSGKKITLTYGSS